MNAAGIIVCAMFWGVAMACLAALVIIYIAAKNERRELLNRLYGSPPPEKDEPPMLKSYRTAHERAIRKWRHDDENTTQE